LPQRDASLAAHSFGGPQAAALTGSDGAAKACLEESHVAGSTLIDQIAAARAACLDARDGAADCDLAALAAEISVRAAEARAAIAGACPDLGALVAVDTDEFVSRALSQADCLSAAALGDTAAFELDCGPRPAASAPPRGEYVQVVLDPDETGTRCGDGSPYAFWVRLAPEGKPVDDVVVGMQGGDVCVFEEDCASRSPDLFESLSEDADDRGPLSSDPAINPLADWTKVYLPYCTQDVFIGGGATSNFPSITVHRFGALNVRAALRWVRDAIWAELDRSTPEGYRPDRVRAYRRSAGAHAPSCRRIASRPTAGWDHGSSRHLLRGSQRSPSSSS